MIANIIGEKEWVKARNDRERNGTRKKSGNPSSN